MQELLQFFIETASIDGNHLTGMIAAALVALVAFMIFFGYIIDKIIDFFKYNKLITIKKVEKIDKVVEVPKYIESSKEYQNILKKLEAIEKNQKDGVKL